MSIKAPTDKHTILNVSGVGEAKYEKYGERFIEAVTAFMEEHSGTVTCIRDEDNAADAKTKPQKKRKNLKVSFISIQKMQISLSIRICTLFLK